MTLPPPVWSDEQLEAGRLQAIANFRSERLDEPLSVYLGYLREYRDAMIELLDQTNNLHEVEDSLEILTNPQLLFALRYLAGPPISEDDLKVLADDASLAPTVLRGDPEMAQRVIEVVVAALDPERFPWVEEGRDPTADERDMAALASAALIAASRATTARRSASKKDQEGEVANALIESGYEQVSTRTIATLAAAPERGQFCGESLFGGRKADFVLRLYDDRVMPIECKVSNSSSNSVKRLNNDTAAKAVSWIREFGTAQTVPAAVISGVYELHNLVAAQDQGLTLWWAHDLDEMIQWIDSTGD